MTNLQRPRSEKKLYKNAFKCWKSVPKSPPITSLYPSTCYRTSRWYQRQRHSHSHRTGRCLLTRTVAERVAQDTGQENYKQCSFHCYENGSGALARIMQKGVFKPYTLQPNSAAAVSFERKLWVILRDGCRITLKGICAVPIVFPWLDIYIWIRYAHGTRGSVCAIVRGDYILN